MDTTTIEILERNVRQLSHQTEQEIRMMETEAWSIMTFSPPTLQGREGVASHTETNCFK